MERPQAPVPEDWPYEALLRRMAHAAHILPLNGEDIEVFESPDQFFQQLLAGLAAAQRRVSIASLYFGTGGGREAEFAAALAGAAHDRSRPGLCMHVLLDALRCTRPTRGATGGAAGTAGTAGAAAGTASAAAAGGATGSSIGSLGGSSSMGDAGESVAGRSSAADGSGASASSGAGSAGSGGPGPPPMTSTAEMLAVSLLEGQAVEGRVTVSLFHTPALRGLLKRVLPPRVSEVIGVMHMKCYVFDDTVLLSGANISSTYLSSRQDRYIVLRNAPQLAAFLNQAVDTVGRFSYQLLPAQAAQQASSTGSAEALRRRDALLLALRGGGAGPAAALLRGGQPLHVLRPHHLQRHRLQRGQRYGLGPCPAGVDPVLGAALFSRRLRAELLQLFVPQPAWHSVLDFAALEAEAAEAALEAAAGAPAGPASAASSEAPAAGEITQAWQLGEAAAQGITLPGSSASSVPDTWVVPLVQAGFAGVRQEERCTLGLLSWATQQPAQQQQPSTSWRQAGPWPGSSSWGTWASAGSTASGSDGGGGPSVLLQLASPYLNLARPLEWFLSRQADSADVELITSSPEANGFFGSKGLSGYVPLAYSLLEHRTWRRLNRRRGASGGSAAAAWLGARGGEQGLLWRQRQAALLPWWVRGARASGGNGGDGMGTLQAEPDGTAPAGSAAGTGAGPGAAWAPEAEAGAQAATNGPARRLLEYRRPGWEFHAKGLWVSLPRATQQAHQQAQQAQQQAQSQGQQHQAAQPLGGWAPPAVTAVGSSNFGFRSLHRDLELQFVLVTRNAALQQALGAEVAALRRHCQVVPGEAHFLAPGRRGGALARVAVRLLRGFL
ncbi:hypothetical protein ABPG77_007174 [Micractinium sp. CCAP 211/92]